MSRYVYEPFEIAKDNLKKKSIKEIETQVKRGFDISIVTNYFLASETIELELFNKKIDLSDEELRKFKNNKKMLNNLRKQIRNNNKKSNLNNYSLGFVLGGLISLLREFEANIEKYDDYLETASKIKELKKDCESEEFLAEIWKKTNESIDEILSYLEMKSYSYFPTLEKIISEIKRSSNNETNSINIINGIIKENHDDREGFYLLSNIIQINPILHKRFEKLCLDRELDIVKMKELLLESLKLYQNLIEDKRVKHLITVFLKNPKYH
ncbi:MAG: hypothetical protein ACW981_18060 [Candidatus Hodarchaeales archaeon]|jgi:hypothetical protein